MKELYSLGRAIQKKIHGVISGNIGHMDWKTRKTLRGSHRGKLSGVIVHLPSAERPKLRSHELVFRFSSHVHASSY